MVTKIWQIAHHDAIVYSNDGMLLPSPPCCTRPSPPGTVASPRRLGASQSTPTAINSEPYRTSDKPSLPNDSLHDSQDTKVVMTRRDAISPTDCKQQQHFDPEKRPRNRRGEGSGRPQDGGRPGDRRGTER